MSQFNVLMTLARADMGLGGDGYKLTSRATR